MMRRETLAAFGLSLVALLWLLPLPAAADLLVWNSAGIGDWGSAASWFNESLGGPATQPPGPSDMAILDTRRGTFGVASLAGPAAALTLSVGDIGSGQLSGYGDFSVQTVINNGEIVAFGSGQQRTLNMGAAGAIENTADNIPGDVRGWTAFQGGRLELPTLSGTTGRWWWGEDPADADQRPDLINSMRIDAYGSEFSPTFHISLLANDRAELPPGTTGTIVGLWDLQAGLGQGAWGGVVDLLVRYDDNTIFNLGLSDREEDLRLYQFINGQWNELDALPDTNTKLIGVLETPPGGSSLLAVGFDIASEGTLDPTIPEPASLGLLMASAAGLAAYLRKRRSR